MPQRVTPWNGIARTLKRLSSRLPVHDDPAEEVHLYYRRACLASTEERYDVAFVFIGKALALDPRHLPTRLLVAQIYDRGLHEIEEAIRAYEKVIALSGYESSNPYCAGAREALDHLVTAATATSIPAREKTASPR